MKLNAMMRAAVVALALGAAGAASALTTTLTFEGLTELDPVGNAYSPFVFDANAYVLVDLYQGGSGNFDNSPPPLPNAVGKGVMFIIDDEYIDAVNDPSGPLLPAPKVMSTVIRYTDVNGFITGFSFNYSSLVDFDVDVLNSANQVIATEHFPALDKDPTCKEATAKTPNPDPNDPRRKNGDFCLWTLGGVAFSGQAQAIRLTGLSNNVAFDNITIVYTPGGTPVTEPAPLALVGAALLGLWAGRRRKI